MRKFRVWCNNINNWETDSCIISHDGKLYHNNNGFLNELSLDDHVIEFSTGYKDDSRKEIYDGDILLCLNRDDETYKTVVCNDRGVLCMEVHNYDYDKTAVVWALDCEDVNSIKVIGNIHEGEE